MSLEDMEAEGYLGLVKAAKRWDASKGARFSTYATFVARGAIIDAIRRATPTSRSTTRQLRLVETAEMELASSLRRAPSRAELAGQLDISPEQLTNLKNRRIVEVELDTSRADHNPTSPADVEESAVRH